MTVTLFPHIVWNALSQLDGGNLPGPTPSEADRAAVLAKVKALGFTDAYFVTN